jgi:hypothetical protein
VKALVFSGKLTERATGRLDFEIPASLQQLSTANLEVVLR